MFKKATKSIAWLAVLVLALSIFTSYFASIQFSAEAAGGVGIVDMFSQELVDSKVKYGDSFTVPDNANITVSVKSPNGVVSNVAGNVVEAKQLGTYEVTVKRNGTDVFYKYNVQCYLDGEYIFVVDKGGAIIPSYWELSEDKEYKIKLPNANVYVYNEDDEEYVKDNSYNVNIRVTSPAGEVTIYSIDKVAGTVKIGEGDPETIGDKDYVAELDLDKVGKWFFTYYAQVEGETNVLSKEFVTQVQKQFKDETAPTLSPPNVPGTASVNTKVTLPTAITSDNYDRNVIVDISVKFRHNGGAMVDVPMTVIDKKTGYVTSDSNKFKDKDDESAVTDSILNAAPAIFDNDRFMYFYPTETGEYTITYQVQDTSCYYNINTKNASVKYGYTLKVTDTTAPVFDSIDDYKIPTEWGNDVYMYDESESDDRGAISDRNIHFPIPEVYDNYDSSEDIAVSFNFTDNGGRTVASFTNINSTEASEDNRYVPSANLTVPADGLPYYFFRWQESEAEYTINSDGLLTAKDGTKLGYDFATVFNFDLWNPKNTNTTTASKHGDYLIVYKALDNAGARNYQSKSYSIRYSSEFEDLHAPDVRFTVPNFISFTAIEEEVKITDVRVTDSGASRINSEYYVSFNKNSGLTKDNFDAIISGDSLIRLDSTLGSNTLKVKKVGSKFQISAKNVDGIEQTVDNVETDKPIYVAVRATDSVGNEQILVKEIAAIDATAIVDKTCTIKENGYNGRTDGTSQLNTGEAVRGKEYCLGNFTIEFADNADRKQTGFEIYAQRIAEIKSGVTTPLATEEAPVTDLAYETYSANDGALQKIYIDNVRFTPSSSGVYMVILRGYHISGLSDVRAYYINVSGTNNDNGIIGANTTIPKKGDVNVTYTLTSQISGRAGSYVVRSFIGGRMSLMFDQFTAMSSATYSLMDYAVYPKSTNYGYISYDYVEDNDTGKISCRPLDGDTGKAPASQTNYSFDASDNQAPSIRLLGVMPVYSLKNTEVILPDVSATSENGIVAKLNCEINYENKNNNANDGNKVSKIHKGGNLYSFVPENDGIYKVNYNAVINGNVSNLQFDISVGDVEPPTFNVIDYGFATSKGESVIGYINDSAIKLGQGTNFTATIGDTFKFGYINVLDPSRTGYTYNKQLIDPAGENADQTTSYSSYGNSVTFTTAGSYTVKYTVVDENNNETFVEFNITVTSSTVNISTEAIQKLSIVLIIIGIILVAGVIIYLVRFRKHKRA